MSIIRAAIGAALERRAADGRLPWGRPWRFNSTSTFDSSWCFGYPCNPKCRYGDLSCLRLYKLHK